MVLILVGVVCEEEKANHAFASILYVFFFLFWVRRWAPKGIWRVSRHVLIPLLLLLTLVKPCTVLLSYRLLVGGEMRWGGGWVGWGMMDCSVIVGLGMEGRR